MIWNKNKKTTYFIYQSYECTAVEEYLEQMAEKGWLLEKINGYLFTFKKIEPKKLKYSVDVFYKISILDDDKSDVAMDYREYCIAAGWNYICQAGKIQVFYREDEEDIIPIQTDNREKFTSIFKASLYNLFLNIFLCILFGINIYMEFFTGNLEYTITSNLSLFSGLIMISFIAISLTELVSFLIWVIRSKINENQDKFIPYNDYNKLKKKNFLNKIYLGIFIIVFMFAISSTNDIISIIAVITTISLTSILGVALIKKFINKNKYSKPIKFLISIIGILITIILTVNITAFGLMIISDRGEETVDLPQKATFTLSDLGYKEEDKENAYERFSKSVLAEKLQYTNGGEGIYLDYEILKSNYPWIINLQKERLLETMKKNGYEIEDTSRRFDLPKNIEVNSVDYGRILIISSDDRIIKISNNFKEIKEYDFVRTVYEQCFEK